MLFMNNRVAIESKPAKPWPSEINPCTNPEHEKIGKAPLWGVRGKVTKVCLYCVEEGAKEYGDRQAYLDSLTPDQNGCDTKF